MFGSNATAVSNQSTADLNYYEALEAVNTNVFIANADFSIVFVNKRARETMATIAHEVNQEFGIDANNLIGVNIDTFHGKRIDDIRGMLRTKSNFPIQSEITFGGLILALQISEFAGPGGAANFIVNWEEISEKKTTENEAARAKGVFQNAPLNILVADLDATITDVNPKSLETLKKIEHLLPIKADEVQGGSYDVFHKKPAHQRKLVSDPKNLPYSTVIQLGEELLDLYVSPIYDANGTYEGPMVTWDIITEKVKTEEMASTNIQMLENAPINMMRADLDFNITYLNKSSMDTLKTLQDFLPVKVDEIEGNTMDVFHKNPDRQRTILKDPSNLPYKAKFKLGPETLSLIAHALNDKEGNYIGPMVTWEVVTEREQLIRNLTDTSLKLSAASEQLSSSSMMMIENAENTSNQANTAATASEEIAAGIANVATSMEEMSSSIKEITSKTNEASSKSGDAKEKAHNTNKTINLLGDSSQDIGNVIKVISSIAQQTNLLALNATIEAARAGEAGKGFAVVANEVKELAKETSDATQEITKKIEAIQGDSGSAVNAIGEVSTSIESLAEIATNIAASVEEQAATTNEVARISTEATQATAEITSNVNQVVQMSQGTLTAAKESQRAASNLAELAQSLNKLVEELKSRE